MVASRKADPSAKKISKLYVEPAELARKLIKELEDSKISRAGQVWARNEYTVFLCREDFGRFRGHIDQLVGKLESHLDKHVRSRRYATSGAITVELTLDPDLKPGFFGVLAEQGTPRAGRPGGGAPVPAGRSVWDVPEDPEDEEYVSEPPRGARAYPPAAGSYSAPSLPRTPSLGAPAMGASVPMPSVPPMPGGAQAVGPSYGRPFSTPAAAERPSFGPPPLARPAPQPQTAPPSLPLPAGAGRMGEDAGRLPRAEVSQDYPAGETIVLKVNGQAREFSQGRVVIGRSRDVDLQIDHADVSRRHAVIYLSEGNIVVKDLGSTNGTMVNGYPVESTVVRPTDAIRIGNCNITAASR
jgi:hypothetical protein